VAGDRKDVQQFCSRLFAFHRGNTVVLLFVRLDVMSVFGLVIGYFFSVDQLGSFRAVVYENKSTGKRIESASLSPLSLSLNFG
jgi:hypothetical protein